MPQRSAFFDSANGDRPYAAADFARLFESVVGRDGVVSGIDDELAVSPTAPASMAVQVGLGSAWIQGRHYNLYDSPEVVEIDEADDTHPRIDRIVLRLDLSTAARKISVEVLKGTPGANPSPPSLTRDAEAWELSLAQVRVEANATQIEAGDITDQRGNPALCGYVGSWHVDRYGARADGETDSTAAIQAAIDAALRAGGGIVILGHGQYNHTGITIGSGITLVGAGQDATILYNTKLDGHAIYASGDDYDVVDMVVRDLTITGPTSNRTSGDGIHFEQGGGPNNVVCTIENVNVEYHDNGVVLDAPITSELKRVRSSHNLQNGFVIIEGTSCNLRTCYASSNQDAGYYLVGGMYHNWYGCAADHNEDGYYIVPGNTNVQAVGVFGGAAEQNSRYGFNFDKVYGFTIQSATVLPAGGSSHHFYLNGCRYGDLIGVYGRPAEEGAVVLKIDDDNGGNLPTDIKWIGGHLPSYENNNDALMIIGEGVVFGDIEVKKGAASTLDVLLADLRFSSDRGPVIRSENGTLYRIVVDNSGNLSTTTVT